MLKTRVITAILLTVTLVAALFSLPPLAWNLLILGIACIAAWEWANLSKFTNLVKLVYIALIAISSLVLMLFIPTLMNFTIAVSALIATAFWLLVAPVLLYTKKQIHNKWLLAVIGMVIVLPFGGAMIGLREIDPMFLLLFIVAVSVADSAAYFAGKNFGKHKLAPNISPGKTWEGVLGGLIGVSIFGLLVCHFGHLSYSFIPLLWLVAVLSVEGDLIESLFKRQANMKDSGNLLPGHGGVLDRIDGLTASLPLLNFLIFLPMYLGMISHG